MIKQILLIIFLVSGLTSFTQGVLRIDAKKNETGNLIDNKTIDSVEVEISLTYVQTQPKKKFTFTSTDKNCYLTPGTYDIEVKISLERTIKICEVLIRDSEYTFLYILIEPEISFAKRQLRKRKHFDNYRKNNCV